jgi:hypothetical protein
MGELESLIAMLHLHLLFSCHGLLQMSKHRHRQDYDSKASKDLWPQYKPDDADGADHLESNGDEDD